MSIKKKNYVQASVVKDIPGDYVILLGGRTNGKSYCIKEICIEDAWNDPLHKAMALVRRYDKDCRDQPNTAYYADNDELVKRITDGQADCIIAYRHTLYFAKRVITESHEVKMQKVKKCGYCFAVSSQEHYKSLQFPEVYNIIYEEFVAESDDYLPNEVRLFQNLISTILRDRSGRIFMVGNTISRICPFYREMGIEKAIKNLKEGDINTIKYERMDGYVQTISIYMTHALDYSARFFTGKNVNSLKGHEYYSSEYPHLEKRLSKYEVIYTMVMKYDSNMFLMQFLKDTENENTFMWYVSPKNSPIQKGTRVITNSYSSDILWTPKFNPLSEGEQTIFRYLQLGKIVYSDDLTGEEYNRCVKYL